MVVWGKDTDRQASWEVMAIIHMTDSKDWNLVMSSGNGEKGRCLRQIKEINWQHLAIDWISDFRTDSHILE